MRRRYQRENERLVTELREGTDKLKAQARGVGPAGPPPLGLGPRPLRRVPSAMSGLSDRASRSPQEKTAYLEHQRMNMQANPFPRAMLLAAAPTRTEGGHSRRLVGMGSSADGVARAGRRMTKLRQDALHESGDTLQHGTAGCNIL